MPISNYSLGAPHLHFRTTTSTNDRAKELAIKGAPHGTLVTTDYQASGRGRQGRGWFAPSQGGLYMSVILRNPVPLLSIRAGIAVATIAGAAAQVKWPNDVLIDGRKIAGILVEGRHQENWAVVGMGVNVAVDIEEFPTNMRERVGTLGLPVSAVLEIRTKLLAALATWIECDITAVLGEFNKRNALNGRPVRWSEGEGTARGIDSSGRLEVIAADGSLIKLTAGEVHLLPINTDEPGTSRAS